MRILVSIEESGVRIQKLITRSLRDELAAAALLSVLQKELAELDRAVRGGVTRGRQRTGRHPSPEALKELP